MKRLGLIVALTLVPSVAYAEDFNVGPGQTYTAIGDVAWESLQPGDHVYIHWRDTPYQEKWVIGVSGTAADPIVVSGVPGPGGELPVIDGRDATTRQQLSYWNQNRGVIKIGGSSTPSDSLPEHIVIENLDVRSARPAFDFTDDGGSSDTYSSNAASIYVEKAAHLTIRNCIMRDSGNGLFIGVNGGQTEDILIEGNHLYDNGISGSVFEHNAYTAALGITYQYNHFGPLRAGCDGNNLKDRSAGLVVRYNWIESGNRQLDLVDGEDDASVVNHPDYDETFVYGNVLIEPDGAGNSQIVHYGGDSGTTSDYRKGTLYFFHNTVVSTRSGNTTLLRLSTNDESADVRNNILYVSDQGSRLAMLAGSGTLDLDGNWVKPGWVNVHGSLDGTLNAGTNVEGTDPGFADEGAQDFMLASGSACLDAAIGLHANTSAPVVQYVKHRQAEPRPLDGPADLGAYELCQSGNCDPAGGGGGGNPVTVGAGSGGGPTSSGATTAGSGGAGTSTTGAGGSAATPPVEDDGGCSCRVGSRSRANSAWLALLGAALWGARRRRRHLTR